MSVVRGNSDNQIETMLRKSMDYLGGMEKIDSSGQTVVVEPPVLTSEKHVRPI